MDAELAVPETLCQQLETLEGIKTVDARLILENNVEEVSSFTVDPETMATLPVGDSRQGKSLVIGINPKKITTSWSIKGRFLDIEQKEEAVVGDSISQLMFSPDPLAGIYRSDPLSQGIRIKENTFKIVGVCVDPINNGKVIYLPIKILHKLLGTSSFNILLVSLDPDADRSAVLIEIEKEVNKANSIFSVFELKTASQKNLSFLGSMWSSVMVLPVLTLASAAICLIAYIILTIEEQRHEFAVLRAIGCKQKTIITILAMQSIIVLLSSVAIGISIGVFITLMILVPQPIVTSYTILAIVEWFNAALLVMFLLSLWPTIRFARKPILEIMS